MKKSKEKLFEYSKNIVKPITVNARRYFITFNPLTSRHTDKLYYMYVYYMIDDKQIYVDFSKLRNLPEMYANIALEIIRFLTSNAPDKLVFSPQEDMKQKMFRVLSRVIEPYAKQKGYTTFIDENNDLAIVKKDTLKELFDPTIRNNDVYFEKVPEGYVSTFEIMTDTSSEKFDVEFYELDHDGEWHVAFTSISNGIDQTNTNRLGIKSIEVFSKVLKTVYMFVDKFKPKKIEFSAYKIDKRDKIYRNMIHALSKKFDLSVEEFDGDDSVDFILTFKQAIVNEIFDKEHTDKFEEREFSKSIKFNSGNHMFTFWAVSYPSTNELEVGFYRENVEIEKSGDDYNDMGSSALDLYSKIFSYTKRAIIDYKPSQLKFSVNKNSKKKKLNDVLVKKIVQIFPGATYHTQDSDMEPDEIDYIVKFKN